MSEELFVVDSGETELPTVVCLHSLFIDNSMYDEFAIAAAGTFRTVRPDFRGQGLSPAATEVVTMDQCADDVIALIENLNVDSVHVVAQSMGGDVAVRVAARRPDLIDRLVLLGTSVRQEPPEHLEAFHPIADTVEAEGFNDELVQTTTEIMLGASYRANPANADSVARWGAHFANLSPGLVHAIRGVITRPSAVSELSGVKAPTLVVSGGEDQVRPPDWSTELADGIANCELWTIPDAGHSIIIEQPDHVIPRVIEFLKSEA